MPKSRKIVRLKFDTIKSGWRLLDTHRERAAFGIDYAEGVSRDYLVKSHGFDDICPYCLNELKQVDYRASNDMTRTMSWYDVCSDCGYWRDRVSDQVFADRVNFPVAASFNQEKNIANISHLGRELLKSPDKVYSTDPRKFEILIGSILSDFLDCDVYHVGGTADGGIDLIAIITDHPCLVQVKRRGQTGAVEGIDTVKLLFASALTKGADSGMVVTSATSFSKPSKKWANELKFLDTPFKMELRSLNNIFDMVNAISEDSSGQAQFEQFRAHQDSLRGEIRNHNEAEWTWKELDDGELIYQSNTENYNRYFLLGYRDIEKTYFFKGPRVETLPRTTEGVFFLLEKTALEKKKYRTEDLRILTPYHLYDQMVRKWPVKFDGLLTLDGDF